MNILKPLTVVVLATPLVLVDCIAGPVIGQQSANKTAVYNLGNAIVCGIVDALTRGGKGARNSMLACGAISARVGGYMDYQAKKLCESLAGADVKVKQQGSQIKLVVPENVTFVTNDVTLSVNTRDVLTAASKTLAQYSDTMLTINGHTDNIGSDATNDPLSRNRAQSVTSFLQSQSVTGSRLTTAGHGSRQPVASNATPEGRIQSRRVEILINPDQSAIKATQR